MPVVGSSVEATDRHPPGMGKREVNMFVQVIQGHVSGAAQVRGAARQMGR